MRVETDIIDSITSSPIEEALIMHVRMVRTDIVVVIGDVMCLSSS